MGLILVVTEDPVEIETIRAALSVHGWWVTAATDRRSALQTAADQAPKLVLVDSCLPDAAELFGSFGSTNGGPGVVALIEDGFEGALELKEAGADELLTKPASPERVLEAVQRCLASPRPGPAQRRVPADRLLTTEEIFGDVLREIGEGKAPKADPAAAEAARKGPAAPLLTTPDDLFETAVADRETSLAGLFDDLPAEAAVPAASEPAASPAADGPGGWRGPERRGVDRPWRSAGPAAAVTADSGRRAAMAVEDADTVITSIAPASSEPTPELPRPEESEMLAVADVAEAQTAPEESEQLVEPAPRARRVPRSVLAIGSLAAVLLVAVGAVLVLGSSPDPAGSGSPAPAPPASLVVEPVDADESEGGISPAALAQLEPPPVPASEEVDDFDIEAIVDEELQRREEVLRRVFLEEEKRLLRELNHLDPDEPASGDESDGD